MTGTLAVVLGGVACVLLALLVMSSLAVRDERARADAAARDADWWQRQATDRREEADRWCKKALDLEEQARAAERKQLQEAFETVVQSEKKTLTVERASKEILWLYEEALARADYIPSTASSYSSPLSALLDGILGIVWSTSTAKRDRMASLVRFLADKAREAAGAAEQKQAG